jgi:ATP-binding cassette subfamily B protein
MGQAFRLGRAVRLVWQCAPGWAALNMVLVILQGLLPLATLYLIKRIIDAVTAAKGAAASSLGLSSIPSSILLLVALAGGSVLLAALCRSLGELAGQAQSTLVSDKVSDILHAQSVAVDLEYYEDTRYQDTLHRAQQEAPYRPTRISNGLLSIGQNLVSFGGVAALLFALGWQVALVLFLAAIPGAMIRVIFARRLFRFEQAQAENERRAWYYHWLLTDGQHAKEVRLFNLGATLRKRFLELRVSLRQGRLRISGQRAWSDFLTQTLAVAALFGALAWVALRTVRGTLSLGDLFLYYSGFQLALNSLQSLLRGLAGLYEDNLFLIDFERFLSLKPRVPVPASPSPVPETGPLVCRGLTFRYPGSERDNLKGVDFTLGPGQVVALVGENGSGKTTLVKLLCRLYDPSAGSIQMNGLDLRSLDPEAWRKGITVIFQDYLRYALTAWENIWLGDPGAEPDRERIAKAAELAGIDGRIGKLPQGYDTMLGVRFRRGQELSWGEWQKMALARAFFRDARIVILDEPTSALDALAEAELFHHFRRLIGGRSAILISHRFATVKMADRIYVMADGGIAEEGTHGQLMERNGLYARMVRAQASSMPESST